MPRLISADTRMRRALFVVLGGIALFALYEGWRAFWFLTDDAYIDFRYVQNSQLGLGYTWNAPPFRPVEGYTSFLWVVLLDVVWRVVGAEPPVSANVMGLLCGAGSIAATAFMLMRLDLGPRLDRGRGALLIVALGGVLANRTFLAWTSSGLEAPLFVFLVLAWVALALFSRAREARYGFGVSSVAALLALTRPDGLLFVASALVLVALGPRNGGPRLRRWGGALPLLTIPAHLLWRHHRYGEWLPNTYYAKVVAPWPEAGVRYLESFCLEYAFWLLVPLALVALAVQRRRLREALAGITSSPEEARSVMRNVTVAGTIVAHVGYYTLRVGGDHFEYRVFAHLVPLAFVSAVWLLARAGLRPVGALVGLVGLVAASLPIPWAHWVLAHKTPPRQGHWIIPVAQAFPSFLRGYVRAFDERQAWLIQHAICIRQPEHAYFVQELAHKLPSREEGWEIASGDHPVLATRAVGLIGWRAPRVAVIDMLGLNDHVVARTPVEPGAVRKMAHERRAPAGYVECFEPNVSWDQKRFIVKPRALTDARIVECEDRFRARLHN